MNCVKIFVVRNRRGHQVELERHTIIVSTREELFSLITEAVRAAGGKQTDNTPADSAKKLLAPKDVEKEFGIHRKMLGYWRMEGIGPTYITFGWRIFYDRTEFEEFVASGKIKTTGYVDR